MLFTSIENLSLIAALTILCGSLLGSIVIYLTREPSAPRPPGYSQGANGYRRPADWPQRQPGGVVHYRSAVPRSRGRLRGVFSLLLVTALVFGVASVAFASYRTPWPVLTDLKHMAAGLHCEVATALGMAGATQGAPGYHLRLDADGNGVTCDGGTTRVSVSVLPPAPTAKLSTVQMVWPTQ